MYTKGAKQEEHTKPIFELHQLSTKHEKVLTNPVEIKAMHHKRSIYKQPLSGVKGRARNAKGGTEQ